MLENKKKNSPRPLRKLDAGRMIDSSKIRGGMIQFFKNISKRQSLMVTNNLLFQS